MQLNWPSENAMDPNLPRHRWFHPDSNCCLDFHGDPTSSELRIFSDGNHHMALEETLESFRSGHGLSSVFYCTTPPKVYLDWIQSGTIEIGNLCLSVTPQIVIGPEDIVQELAAREVVSHTKIFARSRGNSFLVRRNNPKNIRDVRDLLRDDVRLFLSNPVTEKASHQVYRQTLERLADAAGITKLTFQKLFESSDRILFGDLIHHREAPQAIVNDHADFALVYDHLALRYIRIFPEMFGRIPLAHNECNVITRYAVGLIDESDPASNLAFQYFLGETTASIYRHHGLEADQ